MYPLILLLWVVLVGAYINGPIADPDLWWHVTVGKWIVAHREVPSIDLWNSFSDAGVWRAYSWVHEVAYALVESNFGVFGLWVLQLILAIGLVATLVGVFIYLARDPFIGTLLGSVAAVGCFQNFALRPQTFVWILFALVLALAQAGANKRLSFFRISACLSLFCLWANSHVTPVIGLGALFLWQWRAGDFRNGIILVIVGLCATLLTPYLGGEWLALLSQSDHPISMGSIIEFQSATILSYGTGVLILFAVVLIAAVARKPEMFPPARLLLAIVVVCVGAAIVKFLPFAVITLGALLAVYWRESRAMPVGARDVGVADVGVADADVADAGVAEQSGLREGLERLRTGCAWLPPLGSAALLFALCVVVIARARLQPLDTISIPVTALDYVLKNDLATPILNDFGRGGYVMYRMSNARGEIAPDRRVPIDGRTNVNSPRIWSAYRLAVEGQAGWRELLELVKPETILWRRESPLVELLKCSGEWSEVFSSGSPTRGFVVLVRRAQ